jgi:hypothetical protein
VGGGRWAGLFLYLSPPILHTRDKENRKRNIPARVTVSPLDYVSYAYRVLYRIYYRFENKDISLIDRKCLSLHVFSVVRESLGKIVWLH